MIHFRNRRRCGRSYKNLSWMENCEKEDNLLRYTQFFEKPILEILFRMILILDFPKFSVEWFSFREFDNLRIFWNLSHEVSVPFVPVSKIFWLNEKQL